MKLQTSRCSCWKTVPEVLTIIQFPLEGHGLDEGHHFGGQVRQVELEINHFRLSRMSLCDSQSFACIIISSYSEVGVAFLNSPTAHYGNATDVIM